MTRPEKVGVIGLGVMGSRMATNLIKSGYQTIVFNRSPQRARDLEGIGAVIASSPEDVAMRCRTVILSLPTTEAVREVVLGKQGLVTALSKGSAVIDTSTTDPDLPLELSQELLKRGCYFLDAPVSGGPQGAQEGTLTVMVGGDSGALRQSVPILQAIGKSVVHVGPSGFGQKMKLFNQALVAVYFGAVSEAYVWARRMELDPDEILEVVSKSWGDSPVFRHFISVVVSRDYSDGAAVRLYLKDIALVLKDAERRGCPMSLLQGTAKLFARASEEGHGNDDSSILSQVLSGDQSEVNQAKKNQSHS